MVIPAARFGALATLEAVASERATALYGVPAMFIAELEHPDFRRFDLTSLRTGIMAGAPCPIEVMKRVMADMHCDGVTIAYGQTEGSPVVTMSRIDDAIETRVSTVGCPLPNTEIQIVSPAGATVPIGEAGEVCARGYMVMRGYDQDPDATRRAIDPEGWLHTGDLGVMRADGYIKITGRATDMIIRGGENISPREIEEFLHTHPKIAEVQVVGVPDLRLGEAVAVWVRLRAGESATEEEIRKFCRGRIAHFKIPHYVRFVDAFPMTVSGKVQKFRMRDQEIRDRGLEGAADIKTA
jgi:fatty-acyl-CoA synthase